MKGLFCQGNVFRGIPCGGNVFGGYVFGGNAPLRNFLYREYFVE